jgi:hypothetical protein
MYARAILRQLGMRHHDFETSIPVAVMTDIQVIKVRTRRNAQQVEGPELAELENRILKQLRLRQRLQPHRNMQPFDPVETVLLVQVPEFAKPCDIEDIAINLLQCPYGWIGIR